MADTENKSTTASTIEQKRDRKSYWKDYYANKKALK